MAQFYQDQEKGWLSKVNKRSVLDNDATHSICLNGLDVPACHIRVDHGILLDPLGNLSRSYPRVTPGAIDGGAQHVPLFFVLKSAFYDTISKL
ncbi:hypothetical protein A3K29_04590 [Candidatus Collierbacteria bacterium RIFOXYB2_FULL_46_14]|nr:MAG: hypothetical protein A3K29_04590 [Candidatus Collierbacteria bacterium RIFOXYB2_FULL_46_14]OGD76418.1 MAG: hypothetical protein A3K43_04590 [Candidatus Collierbacteria bacterium RIFOXYA2_FULL_46_20]OGD77754.1 MAG: hypothetical protein A3K39_04590 [Candidatus Collierbacteria bacterium RIFOXYC2_FULL_43_15]OGD82476.1 MAG: hypothetical protein A3K36_04590 [Candidatus Collierbacteria bacterium RIFOXYD2_FULL_45_13]